MSAPRLLLCNLFLRDFLQTLIVVLISNSYLKNGGQKSLLSFGLQCRCTWLLGVFCLRGPAEQGKSSGCSILGRILLLPASPAKVDGQVDWPWLSLSPQPSLAVPKITCGKSQWCAGGNHGTCINKQLSHRDYQARSNTLGSLLLIVINLPFKILNSTAAVGQSSWIIRLLIICKIYYPCLSPFLLSLLLLLLLILYPLIFV